MEQETAILRKRLRPKQRHPYVLWAYRRREHTLQDKARTSVLIDKIKDTDFLNVDSREELARHWADACRAWPPTEPQGNHVPIGHHHGRLYAFVPSTHFRNRLPEENDDPSGWGAAQLAAAQRKMASSFYRGLYIRTYDQMSDNPLPYETRKPERRYGRCSGTGLLGCSWDKRNNDDEAGDLRVASSRGVSGSSTSSTTSSSTTASLQMTSAASSHSTATSVTVDGTLHLDRPFFCLGVLMVGEPIGDNEKAAAAATTAGELGHDRHLWNCTHYFVAVSLADCSVWLVYEAWSQLEGDEDYDDDYNGGYDEYDFDVDETPPNHSRRIRFRPERDSDWARLSGDHRRRTMAKLAAHVHDWHIGSFDERMTVDEPAIPETSFLVASLVHEDKEGNLLSPE